MEFQGLDEVTIQNNVRVEELLFGGFVELPSGLEGTVVTADAQNPLVEFTYRGREVLASIPVNNLKSSKKAPTWDHVEANVKARFKAKGGGRPMEELLGL
jgi:hypothetical protein